MKRTNLFASLTGLFLLSAASGAFAQSYAFTIASTQSGAQGNFTAQMNTTGSLIGNFDPTTNSTGTRTKPGTNGTFGTTENDPVPITPTLSLGGPVSTHISGSFHMAFDLSKGRVTLTDYQTDQLSGTPVTLAATLTPNSPAFRTQRPKFIYPALTAPLTLSSASVSHWTFAQNSVSVNGLLRPEGTNQYAFTVAFVAQSSVTLSVNGRSQTVTLPTPLKLSGLVAFANGTAQITSSVGQGGMTFTLPEPVALPTFPLTLPALPEQPAHLLVNLSVSQGTLSLGGTRTFVANGTL